MPLNLLELGGAMGYESLSGSPPAAEGEMVPSALRQARAAGMSVMVNRPLKAIPPLGQASRHLNLGQEPQAGEGDIREAILAALRGAGVGSQADATLAQLALWLAASTHGVDVALCQASSPQHQDALAAVYGWPRAPETAVWEAFDLVLDQIDALRASHGK